MLEGDHPLPQGAGYAVVVGLGAVFAFGMISITFMLRRYQKEIIDAEEFSTAGRSVNSGLIAAAVVSSWTWAATLLQSTVQAYKNGISGGFWYASGATVQVILFATLAIKVKQIAPNCHTFLEIIKVRFGKSTHFVFMYYFLATNILVMAMLLTGGSSTVSFLTGMHPVAAIFLLPLFVLIYTLLGGIKATFITDYVHTIVIVVIIMVFAFKVWATSPLLGSPGAVYDILINMNKSEPVSGNAEGSLLTFHSKSGGIFFVINIIGNFGTVFLDNGYLNKAISSSPAAALPGYVLGGLAWFAIPMFLSTTMGLACRALENSPSFIYYPNKLTADQVNSGLVLPAAAYTLLGKGGAVASLLLVFMAVTSASSAELISVSSLYTYDIHRTYVNPKASGKTLIMVSHSTCVVFTFAMAGFSTGLYYGNVSMGWLYEFMGVVISSLVGVLCLAIFWKDLNFYSATLSPIIGSLLALMSWLASAKGLYGEVTYDTLFEDDVMLIGNVVSLLSPLIFVVIFQLIFGKQNFDFELLQQEISRVDETEEILGYEGEQTENDGENDVDNEKDVEKLQPVNSVVSIAKNIGLSEKEETLKAETELLRRNSKIAGCLCIFMTIALLVVWPMPMYGSKYIFSKKFFTGWICVLFIWIFFTAGVVIVFPIIQGRHGIYTTIRGLYWDCTGQSHKLREWQNQHPEELHVVQSQISAVIHQNDNGIDNAIDDKI